MRIAINTGGGDAPGLNAVIRAVVLAADRKRVKAVLHDGETVVISGASLEPAAAGFRSNLGDFLRQFGRLQEAERTYREALALEQRAFHAIPHAQHGLSGARFAGKMRARTVMPMWARSTRGRSSVRTVNMSVSGAAPAISATKPFA